MQNQKTKYLFLFTIGPVKSFLRESRKTQDIFAGSELLNHLCNLAMETAKTQFKKDDFDIITPNITAVKEKLSIPNRFMAELRTDNDPETLKEKAAALQKTVKEEFEKIPGIKDKDLPQGAKKQLEAHLEIYWLFQKIDSDYKNAFKAINNNLAAIKIYTPFPGLSERGRKCIVDGRRNVKFYRETKAHEISKFPNSETLKKLYQKETEVKILRPDCKKTLSIGQLQKGEGISAVTLRKRLHKNEESFPSTAKVALMHIFEEFEKEGCEKKDQFKTFKENVQGDDKGKTPEWLDHSDNQLFFKDNIKRILVKEKKYELNEDQIRELEDKITAAHEAWSKNLKIPFTPYYALIRFDGDKMGDWFSGDKMKSEIDLKDFQKVLSGAIIDFANTLQSKMEMKKYWGKVVYAGGEDFMAFVNLHKLKETVSCVHKLFNEKINKNAELKEMVKEKAEATLSMGICIAHYKEPLQMVLDKAAKAEKLAKDNNRKSFAITISKHSGEQISNATHWTKDGEEGVEDLWENFHSIINAIVKKKVSSAFLRNIYEYLETYQFSEATRELLDSKIKLYMTRAKMTGTKSNDIETLVLKLKSLHQGTVENFAETLLILDFLQRKVYE